MEDCGNTFRDKPAAVVNRICPSLWGKPDFGSGVVKWMWPVKSVRQLGRVRVKQFYQWLLDTDLALKGSHSDMKRARMALETLFFKMAPLEPATKS